MSESNVDLFAARCDGKTGKDDEVLADGIGYNRTKHGKSLLCLYCCHINVLRQSYRMATT